MPDRRCSARTRAKRIALVIPCLLAACQSAGPRETPVAETTPIYEPGPAAQDTPQSSAGTSPDGWRFHAGLYFWAAGIDGVANAGSLGVPINESFGDILDNLEFAAMLAFEGKKGQWGFRLDGIYLDLEGSSDGMAGTTTTEIESLIAEADLLFSPRGNPGLDFIGGVRVLSVETTIDFPVLPTASGDATMIDPIIGAQGTWDLGESWKFRLRGDVGGFGVSSEMTYQFLGFFRWAFADAWGLDFGYRLLGYDIKQSSVDLDAQFQGFILGVDYAF